MTTESEITTLINQLMTINYNVRKNYKYEKDYYKVQAELEDAMMRLVAGSLSTQEAMAEA